MAHLLCQAPCWQSSSASIPTGLLTQVEAAAGQKHDVSALRFDLEPISHGSNIPVCFIGLETLGKPMAAKLLAAVASLIVYNRSIERAAAIANRRCPRVWQPG